MFRTKSYLEDTPDFLRFLQAIGDLSDGAILTTVDVYALYSNIKRVDVVEAVRKALETRKDKMVPAFFILDLFDLVLKYNVFEFDRQLHLQLIGTSMGTQTAPNIADIFMIMLILTSSISMSQELNMPNIWKFKCPGASPNF